MGKLFLINLTSLPEIILDQFCSPEISLSSSCFNLLHDFEVLYNVKLK